MRITHMTAKVQMKRNEVKKKAIEALKNYNSMCIAEQNLREELTAVEKMLEKLWSNSSLVSSYSQELEQLRAKRDKLQGELGILLARKHSVDRSIAALPSKEQTVLRKFFITPAEKGSAEELMEEMDYEKTQIYRIRERALRRFAINLFGVECA